MTKYIQKRCPKRRLEREIASWQSRPIEGQETLIEAAEKAQELARLALWLISLKVEGSLTYKEDDHIHKFLHMWPDTQRNIIKTTANIGTKEWTFTILIDAISQSDLESISSNSLELELTSRLITAFGKSNMSEGDREIRPIAKLNNTTRGRDNTQQQSNNKTRAHNKTEQGHGPAHTTSETSQGTPKQHS
jgi:hypothetical protein